MTTSVSSKGQIVLPAQLRKKHRIRAGQKFTVEHVRGGEFRLILQKEKKTEGLVDWLRKCPVKGYFVPIKSESTDTLWKNKD